MPKFFNQAALFEKTATAKTDRGTNVGGRNSGESAVNLQRAMLASGTEAHYGDQEVWSLVI
ncbi:hypothetical protein BG52_03825 [Paenibacillus darwinianus]|nr:hypothetical protein CH50_07160 [Paenibacillus darwinianus]EXX87579.1 hypothetical protein BG52_03825 [Paenibacillus darwinianus]